MTPRAFGERYPWPQAAVTGTLHGALLQQERIMGLDTINVVRTLAVSVGTLLGGLIAYMPGAGSTSSFFSVGTWLIAFGGAFALLMVFGAVVVRRDERRDTRVRA